MTTGPTVGGRRPDTTALATELGRLALAVGTAASFNRLFTGWDFLGRLLPTVVIGWALAAALRRLRAPVGVGLAVHLVVGAVLLTVQFAPGTHLLGLPTPDTAHALGRAIESSFAEFSELVAPVPPRDGFLVVIAAGLWIFAAFLDIAAERFHGTVQAAVPHTTVFVTVGVLARSSGRTLAVALFGTGLLLYAVTQVGSAAAAQRWVDGHERRGVRAFAGRSAVVGALALVAGIAVAPLVAVDRPPVDLRELGRGDGPRTVVSPFVGLRSLLGQRSDQVVFTVEADEPAYWRLTALEKFDEGRHIWVSSGSYSAVRERLPDGGASRVPGAVLRQRVEVRGLGGLWLPGAYVPNRIEADRPVSYDQASASIIRRDEDDGDGLTYVLESTLPDFGVLGRGVQPRGDHAAGVSDVHLQVPDLGIEVTDVLAAATSGETEDHARLLALQDWFRSRFAYDESVDYTTESDPLAAFLAQRRGFCQQFSSAFALMARALGYPSRVAVGFTPGDADGKGKEPGTTRFTVRGRHAHAWPEVHLAGIGWVPFEPTPQRGDPQGVEHTGVAPAQAAPPPDQATTTTTAGDDERPATTAARTPGTSLPDRAAPGRDAASGDGSNAAEPWVLLALVPIALGALAVAARRRRRGTAPGGPARSEVAGAWHRALRALRRSGLRPRSSETPEEFARRTAAAFERVGAELPPHVRDGLAAAAVALAELARLETRARFGPGAPSNEERDGASAAASAVAAHADALSAAGAQLDQASSSVRRKRSLARDPALLK